MHSDEILLVELTQTEFPAYRKRIIEEYSEESATAGRIDQDGAMDWATKETDRLLPDGTATKDTYILKIMSRSETDVVLGFIWSGRDPNNVHNAFIFDVLIYPKYRSKGYGTAALQLLEAYLRKRGYIAIGLHVYAKNEVALGLYQKCGYKPISYVLSKHI